MNIWNKKQYSFEEFHFITFLFAFSSSQLSFFLLFSPFARFEFFLTCLVREVFWGEHTLWLNILFIIIFVFHSIIKFFNEFRNPQPMRRTFCSSFLTAYRNKKLVCVHISYGLRSFSYSLLIFKVMPAWAKIWNDPSVFLENYANIGNNNKKCCALSMEKEKKVLILSFRTNIV